MPKLPPFMIALYGPQNPNRVWAFLLTACVIAFLFRGTRRAGGFGFIGLSAMMVIGHWLQDAYRSFTPH